MEEGPWRLLCQIKETDKILCVKGKSPTNSSAAFKEQRFTYRSSPPEVFLRKNVLKISCKFTRERPYRSVISTKLHSNFIEIPLRHGCSPVNLLHIFRTSFYKNTYVELLLYLGPFCENATVKDYEFLKNLMENISFPKIVENRSGKFLNRFENLTCGKYIYRQFHFISFISSRNEYSVGYIGTRSQVER